MSGEPRFSLQLPEELNNSLNMHIPWGSKNNMVLALLIKLNEQLKKHGRMAVVDILDGNFEIKCNGIVRDE